MFTADSVPDGKRRGPVCKTSLPGSNLGGASKLTEQIRHFHFRSEAPAVRRAEMVTVTCRLRRLAAGWVEALVRGTLPRAMRIGRTVPLLAHSRTHPGARQTVLALMQRYVGDPLVTIAVFENPDGGSSPRLVRRDNGWLRTHAGEGPEVLADRLRAALAAERATDASAPRSTTGPLGQVLDFSLPRRGAQPARTGSSRLVAPPTFSPTLTARIRPRTTKPTMTGRLHTQKHVKPFLS